MLDDIVILLAEDECFVALALQEALEDGGYTVRSVCDAASAMPEISLPAHDIAGLITDIRMGPGASGWDVARLAREVYPGLPVIYMSGDSAASHTSRGVPDSIMIQKPFAHAQMLTAISSLLNLTVPAR